MVDKTAVCRFQLHSACVLKMRRRFKMCRKFYELSYNIDSFVTFLEVFGQAETITLSKFRCQCSDKSIFSFVDNFAGTH